MGTVVQTFEPLAGYNTGSVIAELYVPSSGPTLTPGWAFAAPGTNLEICFPSQAVNYGGGNATLQIDWYCPAATTGTATWVAKVIAVTPGDAESVESSDNATSTTSIATTVNGTAGGLTRTTISISALDAMAAGDKIWVKLRRDTTDTSIAQTIYLTEVILSYGDGLAGNPGTGDVVGPASATDNDVVAFDLATGKLVKDSGISAANLVTATAAAAATGRIPFAAGANKALSYSAASIDAAGALTGITTINGAAPGGGSGDFVGPAASVAGNVISFANTTGKLGADSGKVAANLVSNVSATGASEIAVFSDTTGKLITGGGTTLGSVVKNTGPSVVDSNLTMFFGTSGLDVRDTGIAKANVVSQTGQAADDSPSWNGSIYVPKFRSADVVGTAQNITATALADITELTVVLPRAGSYAFAVNAMFTQNAAATMGVGINYTGTVTAVRFAGFGQNSNTAAVYLGASANNTAGTWAVASAITVNGMCYFQGGVVVSTGGGTLSVRFQRSTGTCSLLQGSSWLVMEE